MNTPSTGLSFSLISFLLFVFLCIFSHGSAAAPVTLTYSVSQSSDDAEEQGAGVPGSAGTMESLTSSDLELVYESGSTRQVVGVRFQGVTIAQGATSITDAYVQFTADNTNTGTTNLLVFGEDEDNPLTFSSSNGDITGRTKTANSASWTGIPAWNIVGEAGVNQRTPNLATIISEIVQRPGWSSFNSIVIIIEPDAGCTSPGCEREAESFDGTAAPQLVITLDDSEVVGGSPPTPGTCFAVSDGTDELVLVESTGFNAGSGTLIGSVGVPDIEAATYDTNKNLLYGADADQLGNINPNSGQFFPLAQTFGTGTGTDGSVNFTDVDGLTYDITNDKLYGTQARGGANDVIIEIDKITGAHVPLAFNGGTDDYLEITGASGEIDDIAINPIDGKVYIVTTAPGFYEIDLSTGVATDLGAITGAADIEGMDFDDNGVLYGTTGAGELFTIDISTSVATAVGSGFGIGSDYEAISCVFGIGSFDPVAYYRMDESWTVPGANEVLDYSGNDNHGDTIQSGGGTAVSNDNTSPALPGDPGTCGYGVFALNGNNNIHAVAADFTPGNQGSISFWYNSNEDWTGTGTGDRLLFDASRNIGDENADKHFFLVRRNNNGGALRFVVEDTNDTKLQAQVTNLGASFVAGDWVHIAVTWDLPNDRLEIYVNAVLVATDTAPATNGTIGNIQSLYIGDNRDTGLGGNGWSNDSTNGLIDEVRIYSNVISDTVVTRDFTDTHVCSLVDHYSINFPAGSPGVCDPAIVEITAHDVADNPTDVTSGVVLDFSTLSGAGTWGPAGASPLTGSGTWSPSGANDGDASYTWPGGESLVEVELAHIAAVTENINLSDGSFRELVGDAVEDADITFSSQPLIRLTGDGSSEGSIATDISGKDSDVAPAQTLYIQLKQSGVTAGGADACETNGYYSGVNNVQVAAECIDPNTCAGQQVTVEDNTGTPIAINTYDAGGVPASGSWSTIAFNFDGTAGDTTTTTDNKASLVFNYPDAGKIILHFDTTINPAGPGGFTPSVNFIGSSNDFVVRPFGFRIDNFSPANPAATDENGGVFTQAGATFTADFSAVVWEVADDDGSTGGTADDGIPDSNTALAGNNTTPNFGNELTAVEANLSHSLVAPTGGSSDSGILTGDGDFGGFSSGVVTGKSMAWDEVGIIKLIVNESNNDYLAGGQDITGEVPFVGRFTPAELEVTRVGSGLFEDSCSGFTYQDQTFYFGPGNNQGPRIRVRGLDTSGNRVINYDGVYFKLQNTTLPRSYSDLSGSAANFEPPIIDTTVEVLNLGNINGNVILRLRDGTVGDAFMYSRVSEEAPFTASAQLTFEAAGLVDDDNVCYDGTSDGNCATAADFDYGTIGGTELRFGRLNIGSTAGPEEVLTLSVPFVAESHDGTGFITNVLDTCTTISDLDTNLVPDLLLSNSFETAVVDGDIQICDAGGSSTMTLGNNPLSGGDGLLTFSPPGTACTGFSDISIDLTTMGLDHLLYDWDGVDQAGDSDTFDDNPTGRATFGIISRPKEVIYSREPW